jgi:hypothetical protein
VQASLLQGLTNCALHHALPCSLQPERPSSLLLKASTGTSEGLCNHEPSCMGTHHQCREPSAPRKDEGKLCFQLGGQLGTINGEGAFSTQER